MRASEQDVFKAHIFTTIWCCI